MIGSSDVKTVRETHSHYFGIETYENILENLEASIRGFSRKLDLDIGARQILLRLHSRHAWSKKRAITEATLKNHFCRSVITFDSSLATLLDRGLLIRAAPSERRHAQHEIEERDRNLHRWLIGQAARSFPPQLRAIFIVPLSHASSGSRQGCLRYKRRHAVTAAPDLKRQ